MRLVPNPNWVGAATDVLPVSRHMTVNFAVELQVDGFSQVTDTWPPGIDSAPYFAAFVTSSWSTIASACVVAAVSIMSGPPMLAFASVA